MTLPQPSNANSASTLWRELAQTFCISLADRTDRQRQAKDQFQRVGLDGHVQFHWATAHPQNSEQGIFESHLACLKRGLASHLDNPSLPCDIAIFEDDIQFHRFSTSQLEQIHHFMKSEKQWDVLFLGCFAKSSKATNYPGIRSIRYQCTAHGYIVSAAFAQKLAELPWTGKAYDDMLRDLPGGRYFALYPAMAYQSDSPSDNSKTRGIDRIRRLLGGMAGLQRFNEIICRHWTSIVAGHIIAILLLALLLTRFWR